VFWELGQTQDGKSALINPQSLNSYSYSNNNPITYSDPNGKYIRNEENGYVGLKGIGLSILEDQLGGVIMGNFNIYNNSSIISGYENSNIIKSIIFEEQSHGIDDIISDRYPILGSGNTVGLGQITIDDPRSDLGYGSYSRSQLLDSSNNVKEINNRINSIGNQLNEIGIDPKNENYVGYIASAYNNQNNLGLLSNYGKRVQAYYNDVSSGKLLVPENNISGKVLQSINTLLNKKDK